MDAKRWAKYPVRTCRTVHECELCEEDIVVGQTYHDGGHGRRAHTTCVVPPPVDRERKSILYEAAKLLEALAERHRINYTERDAYRTCAKILRKEGRDPGAVNRWLAIEKPTTSLV